jgi:glycosyltransferase involved in cell wall biosynthesis
MTAIILTGGLADTMPLKASSGERGFLLARARRSASHQRNRLTLSAATVFVSDTMSALNANAFHYGIEQTVSIIVPVKDRALLLPDTLHSVRSQTHPHWELIIVDDGSSDSTLALLQHWALQDRRIHLLRREGSPSGANRCRNLGVKASTGEYIIFLDSDDCLAPVCLADRVSYMLDNPHIDFGVFGCHLFRVTPDDSPLYYNVHSGRSDLVRFLAWDNPWGTSCPIWRRSALQGLCWDESLPSVQDWDFHIRALISGLRYEKVPIADWYYRLSAPDRPSTSRQIGSPQHLVPYERLLCKVWRELRERGLLAGEPRTALAGAHFTLAACWSLRGYYRNSRRVWRAALRRKLVTRIQHVEGSAYLSVYPNRFMRRAVRLYLSLRWPSTLQHRRSPTRFRASSLTTTLARPKFGSEIELILAF